MSDVIMAQYGHIEEASQAMARVAQQVQQDLEELNQVVARLDSSWTGSASSDYQAKQAQANRAAADMPVKCNAMATTAQDCLQSHQQAEQRNTSLWG